jgi:hypothetical protein
MKVNLTKEQVTGIVRHTLTFVGGILVMKGIVDEGLWSEVTGATLTLTGAIWSILDKK